MGLTNKTNSESQDSTNHIHTPEGDAFCSGRGESQSDPRTHRADSEVVCLVQNHGSATGPRTHYASGHAACLDTDASPDPRNRTHCANNSEVRLEENASSDSSNRTHDASGRNTACLDRSETTESSLPPGRIRFLQANLAKRQAASAEISQYETFGSDVCLIQEPSTRDGVVVGLPMRWRVVHDKSGGNAAIAVPNVSATVSCIKANHRLAAAEIWLNGERLVVISVYFGATDPIEECLSDVESILNQFNGAKIIVGGDFNAWHTMWGLSRVNTSRGDAVAEFFCDQQLALLNNPGSSPTFEGVRGHSWIDLTAVSRTALPLTGDWQVMENTASDHNYISFYLDSGAVASKVPSRFSRNPWRLRKAIQKVSKELENLEDRIQYIWSERGLEAVVTRLYTILHNTLENRAVLMKRTETNSWWSDDLRVLRKEVRALKRRSERAVDPNERMIFRVKFKQKQAVYRRTICQRKQEAWVKLCDALSRTNPWALPYKLASKIRRREHLSMVKKVDGTLTVSSEESVREIFRHIFAEEGPDTALHTRRREAVETHVGEADDLPFTATEVDTAVKRAKLSKAPGPDRIHAEAVRELHRVRPELLLKLFNKCLALGKIPKAWKDAQLILIPKPNRDPSNASSYRPICLLNVMGKLYDRLLADRVQHLLVKSSNLHENQFGFVRGRSCDLAMFTVRQRILAARKERKGLSVTSLDIKGAFDNAWWPSILDGLIKAGCPANIYAAVRDYLRGRTMTYRAPEGNIEIVPTRGCPQGSCIGPILWNVVCDRFLRVPLPEDSEVIAFADDLLLLSRGKTGTDVEKTANKSLRTLAWVASEAKLQFTLNKTRSLYIRNGGRYRAVPPKLMLEGFEIEQVEHLKYLGVTFDGTLNFKTHMAGRFGRALKLFNAIRTAAPKFFSNNPILLKRIYQGAIEPMLLYGIGAWGTRTELKYFRMTLESIQRPFLRIMTHAFKSVSSPALQVLAGVMPLGLKAQVRWANFLTGVVGGIHCVGQSSFGALNVEKRLQLDSIHPIQRVSVPFVFRTPKVGELDIYTDGSGINGKVGAAFVVYYFGSKIGEGLRRLHEDSSVFQAELLAVQHALNWCIMNPCLHRRRVTIYSDSLSVLTALRNAETCTERVISTKQTYLRAVAKDDVTLCWVKAHAGYEGNEEADRLAKLATEAESAIYIRPLRPLSSIRRSIKESFLDVWKSSWMTDERGRWTFELCPEPDEAFLSGHSVQTQLLSGHGWFRKHSQRIGKDPSGECLCGDAGDARHYLVTCPWTEGERRALGFPDEGPKVLKDTGKLDQMRALMRVVELIHVSGTS